MASYRTYIITPSGERVDFSLDVSKRKRCSLQVREGKLTVKMPERFRREDVKKLIEDNIDWIHSSMSRSSERYGLPQKFEDGERIRLLGKDTVICFEIADRYFPPISENGRLRIAVRPDSPKDYAMEQINGFISSLAEKEIRESFDRLTAIMKLLPNKVTLKSMTASWGRCSSDGNISINYKVITYPKKCIDYVCIHELAHLVHMDHSREFWSLVGRYCPDYKEIRASMKF